MTKLLWLDVETTGLHPQDSQLLQVAGIITDVYGDEISEEFNEVVFHSNITELRDSSIEYVQKMHDKTGLWDRLDDGIRLEELDNKLYEFITALAPEARSIRLAGNSVRLDFNFLEAYLPKTAAHLHYRVVDCSVLDFVYNSWGFVRESFKKEKTHDAIDDIRESLEEYKWLNERIATEIFRT